jgi:hypothetical protein
MAGSMRKVPAAVVVERGVAAGEVVAPAGALMVAGLLSVVFVYNANSARRIRRPIAVARR